MKGFDKTKISACFIFGVFFGMSQPLPVVTVGRGRLSRLVRRPLVLSACGVRPSPRSHDLRVKALSSNVVGQQRRRLWASFPSPEALLYSLGSRRGGSSSLVAGALGWS